MRKPKKRSESPLVKPSSTVLDALVIGAGIGGICLGVKLKQAGLSFRIIEKASNVGGTWRDNTYPGCACDTPSHSYSFSFAPNPDWTHRYPGQPEILDYLKKVVRDFEILPMIHFGEQATAAHFDEDARLWRVTTATGARYNARFVISSVGQLNHPARPDIPGLNKFNGPCFHSAEWDHSHNLRGKTVAVIGTGASATQLIPQVAKQARELLVFQRSPNWLIPKEDRAYSEHEKNRFRQFPLLARLYRYKIYWDWERTWPEFVKESKTARRRTREIARDIASRVKAPQLATDLTPEYALGCKRILLADDFYPALQQDNVSLVTDGIKKINKTSITTEDGQNHRVDVIVLATGFHSQYFLKDVDISGIDGVKLHDRWNGRPHAYLGICVPGFPNFFFTYGPNTNLGHNSITFMIECQAQFIMQAIDRASTGNSATIEVTDSAMSSFLGNLTKEMERTAWTGDCSSWYKNDSGDIINNWSTTTFKYWWRTRRPDWSHFNLTN